MNKTVGFFGAVVPWTTDGPALHFETSVTDDDTIGFLKGLHVRGNLIQTKVRNLINVASRILLKNHSAHLRQQVNIYRLKQ